MNRINNEKLKLENDYEANKTVIDATITTIEESKDLLKQYTNKFVDDIQILNHFPQ